MKLIKQLLSLFLIWTSSTGFQSKNFITNNHILHKTKLTLSRRDIISKTSSFLTYIHFDDKSGNHHKMEEEPEKPTEIIIPKPSIVSNSQLNIRIVGEITEENCARLGDVIIQCDNMAKQLNEETNTTNPISIHITSSGGSLMPTLYICDLIKYIDTEVHTFVDGYAASSASLISICGDKRFITKHSSMLIHQLSGDASGKFTEIKDKYSHMEQLMNNVADIYLTNTNLTPENLAYLLQHDIWLNSTTCLQLGLIDQIL